MPTATLTDDATDTDRTHAFFEAMTAINAAENLATKIDNIRFDLETAQAGLAHVLDEAKGQLGTLKALAGGKPTDREELLAYLAAHPAVLLSGRPDGTQRPLRFTGKTDGRLHFAENGPFGPVPVCSIEARKIRFRRDGFTTDTFGMTHVFTYADPDPAGK